jgi:uncharacterized protein
MAELNDIFFCPAEVSHTRLKPKRNHFFYRVFYLCFDITKTQKICSKFLSLNRFNLFSFYNKDHGKRDGSNFDVWIREILAQKNLEQKIDKIFLLTHPRVLGHVFNPVSFWFCLDKQKNLIAVLSEVNNTFGENHNYLISNFDQSPILENQWFEANKQFHVSPFFEVKGSYKFRFIFNEKKIAAWIDYLSDSNQKSLLTSVVCNKKPISDFTLIKYFFSIPLMTFKVIFLIHWQAVKLLIAGNKYIPKPQKQKFNLTTNNEKL